MSRIIDEGLRYVQHQRPHGQIGGRKLRPPVGGTPYIYL